MKKPVYIPTFEEYNQRQSDLEQMRTFREQMRILALAFGVGMVGAVLLWF